MMSQPVSDPTKIHGKHYLHTNGTSANGITWGRGFHILWADPNSDKPFDGSSVLLILNAAKDRAEHMIARMKAVDVAANAKKCSKYETALAAVNEAIKALE